MLDCPGIVDPNVEWWTGMGAVTLDRSDLTESDEYTGTIPGWFNDQLGRKVTMQGKTVHVIVHIAEPDGSMYQVLLPGSPPPALRPPLPPTRLLPRAPSPRALRSRFATPPPAPANDHPPNTPPHPLPVPLNERRTSGCSTCA